LLQILKTNPADLSKKEKKVSLMIALKVLCLLITKGKVDDDTKIDIIKNALLPGLLINLLKTILKLDNNK